MTNITINGFDGPEDDDEEFAQPNCCFCGEPRPLNDLQECQECSAARKRFENEPTHQHGDWT